MKVIEERNPNANYARLNELSEEFTSLWNRIQGFYLDAIGGFTFVREHVEAEQARARSYVAGTELDSEEFQDTVMFSYDGIFIEEFCTSGIHRATQGEVKARNARDGSNFNTLAQLCIASFYDFWHDYLRREYVIAKGLLDPNERDTAIINTALREHATHDLWGDLYYLRTSIVHKQGVSNSAVAKCKIFKWFVPGEPIVITPERMRSIFLALLTFRNELFSQQFPPRYMVFC
jgi:hypothetical protein